jgi:hypothetical protein
MLTTHLQLMPRSKCLELFLHSPLRFHGAVHNETNTSLPDLIFTKEMFVLRRPVGIYFELKSEILISHTSSSTEQSTCFSRGRHVDIFQFTKYVVLKLCRS